MAEPHRRFKIKIKDTKSGCDKWVKIYNENGKFRFVLRGEASATKFPKELLFMDELVDFLKDKDFELVLDPYIYTSSIL